MLKKLRQSKNLTQEDVARVLNISRAHYSKLENGKSVLNANQIINLADFFTVTTDELLEYK